ncbi:hypothetical protein GCM10007874_11290 [Labrys miyagiensis]|uniref:Uncharacterized protein n=1 Tax=Labrys miyagiensis TaxID=346912 RepID=A0ABQ6CEM4_9HYPH|nr:hypothetical protein [Labrys miyagiensis]GLS18113.1 hypothetical protein GCM10007874_11290 [Labrys miyagiensis]
MPRSIDLRLQRLEGAANDSGGLVIMSCRHGGTHEGAKAFFEETVGCPIEQKGSLVLERPRCGTPIAEAEPGLPPYEIRAIMSGAELGQLIRAVNGKTRGLPATIRRDV